MKINNEIFYYHYHQTADHDSKSRNRFSKFPKMLLIYALSQLLMNSPCSHQP